MPSAFQAVGDQLIWIFAAIDPSKVSPGGLLQEIGSTEYAKSVFNQTWGVPPSLDLAGAARLNAVVIKLAEKGLIHSASDVSDGGLPVTLARSTFENGVGCEAQMSEPYGDITSAYEFSEEPSIVVSCSRENEAAVLKTIVDVGGLGGLGIGYTTKSSFVITAGDMQFVSSSVEDLRALYSSALESQLTEEVLA